jgi:di/tricarboxylate transporter
VSGVRVADQPPPRRRPRVGHAGTARLTFPVRLPLLYVRDVPDPRIRFVYDDARGELARQLSAIDELRARVGALLSAATIATGFLAGQLASKHHHHGLPWSAWVAAGAAVGVIGLAGIVLLPLTWQGGKTNIDTLLSNIDEEPDQSLDDYLRNLAKFTSKHVKANEPKLKWLYRAFTAALVLLCVDLVGWIWALAHG